MRSACVGAGLAALVLVYGYFRHLARPSLSMIRGPISPSFILGNMLELFQRPVGEANFAWQALYGKIIRLKGAFGEDYLLVTDPKALQKILDTSAYVRPKNFRTAVYATAGRAVAWAVGEDYKRYKTIMAPGLGLNESRAWLPAIKEWAESFSMEWFGIIGNTNDKRVILDVRAWVSHGILGALSHAIFHTQFGAIENDSSHPFTQKYQNYVRSYFVLPSAPQIFVQVASNHFPMWLLQWFTDYAPYPRLVQLREFKNVAINLAKELVRENADTLLHGESGGDIFTRLVKANMDASAKHRLTKEELLTLMNSILLGGPENIALSITWILKELSKNLKVQSKLRDEIRTVEAIIHARGNLGITSADLEAMPYLNAVIKEGLRFHPINPYTLRMASQDDTLPLSKPILTEHGDMINEVPVPKGTQIIVSIAAYNRDEDLWGEDAHVFNPDRWLDGTVDEKKLTGVGAYANMLTFLGGPRACLGRRLAIVTLQAFLFELVGKFEFGMTDKAERVVRRFTLNMVPVVEGEFDRGVQMPLAVSLAPA